MCSLTSSLAVILEQWGKSVQNGTVPITKGSKEDAFKAAGFGIRTFLTQIIRDKNFK